MIKQNITKTRTKMILITKTLVIFLLGGQVSEWRSVLSRVHQGSVLGPLQSINQSVTCITAPLFVVKRRVGGAGTSHFSLCCI